MVEIRFVQLIEEVLFMKVMLINGSPRKHGNTAILLNKAIEGLVSKGVETELVNLYDLTYKGCISCFACKLKGGRSYGKCAAQDDLAPILRKVEDVDAIILGSPIYIGSVTGEMKSLLERLTFQYLVYDKNHTSLFKKKIKVGLIYTMGAPEKIINEMGYEKLFKSNEMLMERIFGEAESLIVTDTYQFDDYLKYVATAFDPEEKLRILNNEFPKDCKKAFELGVRLSK